jgi:hypothetical protein
MRARLLLTRVLPVAALTLAAGLGAASVASTPAPVGGPPPVRTWQRACAGKPSVPVGHVTAAVVERPGSDEAVVRADWARGPVGQSCRLELVLPEGASLVEGEEEQALRPDLAAGTSTWRVRFRTTVTSDLVVRMCAVVDDVHVGREAYVRLWEREAE